MLAGNTEAGLLLNLFEGGVFFFGVVTSLLVTKDDEPKRDPEPVGQRLESSRWRSSSEL
jgi:hypothetical protein